MPPSRGSAGVWSARSSRATAEAWSTSSWSPNEGPPGKCRAAYLTFGRVLPAATREEAEQREHEDDDQDDPENAHVRLRVDCLRGGVVSAWRQRETAGPR